jgi:hypothetical protein
VLFRRWPTWVAIALTVLIALDMSEGADLAPAVAASALIYLGAATLGKPVAAWAVFLASVVVILATEALWNDGATWVLLGLAAPLVAYGLWSGVARSDNSFVHQAIAMVAFGAAAAFALSAGDDVGAYLVAGGLLGHAGWDSYHYRRTRR